MFPYLKILDKYSETVYLYHINRFLALNLGSEEVSFITVLQSGWYDLKKVFFSFGLTGIFRDFKIFYGSYAAFFAQNLKKCMQVSLPFHAL